MIIQSYLQYRSLHSGLQAQLVRTRGFNHNSPSDNAGHHGIGSRTPAYSTEAGMLDANESPVPETLCELGPALATVLSGIAEKTDLENTVATNTPFNKLFLVGFEGPQDPLKPRNWSVTKRVLCTLNVGVIALVVGTAASIDSAVIPQAAADFGVSEIVEALATGLVSNDCLSADSLHNG